MADAAERTIRPSEEEPNFQQAFERVMQASAEVVTKRLDLLQHDARRTAEAAVRVAIGAVAAAFFAATAWWAGNAALLAYLTPVLGSVTQAWLCILGLNMVALLVAALVAVRSGRNATQRG